MQEEVRRIARTSGHITHGDAVKLEHAADLLESQAAQLQEARRLFAQVAGDEEWDEETVAAQVDWQWVCEVRAFLAKSQ